VTIQEAVKICLAKEGYFARPVSWKKTACAIDLGRKMDHRQIRRFSVTRPDIAYGLDWNTEPEELLADWEIVTSEDLAAEACETGEPDV